MSTPIKYGYGRVVVSKQALERIMAFCEPCANQQHDKCPNYGFCFCAHKETVVTNEEQSGEDATASE